MGKPPHVEEAPLEKEVITTNDVGTMPAEVLEEAPATSTATATE